MPFNPVDLKTRDNALRIAWFRLQNKLVAALGDAGFDHVYYVDANDGNNTTAQRGSLSLKWLTIQAAVNQAETDGFDDAIVFIGPGTYAEQVTVPEVAGLALIGASPEETIIAAPAGLRCITCALTDDTMQNLVIRDLRVDGAAGVAAIVVDGVLAANQTFLTGKLLLDNVLVGGENDAAGEGIVIDTINVLEMNRVASPGPFVTRPNMYLLNVGPALIDQSLFNDVQDGYDAANPQPAFGRNVHKYRGCSFETFDPSGVVSVELDAECEIRTDLDGHLDDSGVGLLTGLFVCRGRIAQAAGFEVDLTNVGEARLCVDISDAVVEGGFNIQETSSQSDCIMYAKNTVFLDVAQGAIVFGNGMRVHMWGASFDQDAIDATACTGVNRTHHVANRQTLAAGNNTIDIENANGTFPFLDTNYVCTWEELKDAAVAPTIVSGIAFHAKLVDSVDGFLAGAETGDAQIVFHHVGNHNTPQ